MNKRVKIPVSVEAATDRLVALDGIATATGWERAAIVFAFTRSGQGARTDLARHRAKLTSAEFARLGIAGLRKRDTVTLHRGIWEDAIESGDAEDVQPGDSVILPTRDYPETRTGTDGYSTPEGARKTLRKIMEKHGGDVLVEVEPEIARHVATNPTARRAVRDAVEQEQASARQRSTMPRPKGTMPEKEQKALTELDVQMAVTELHLHCSAGVRAACEFHDDLQAISDYLSEDARGDLRELVERSITAWQMARDSLTGVTDESLWAEMEEM